MPTPENLSTENDPGHYYPSGVILTTTGNSSSTFRITERNETCICCSKTFNRNTERGYQNVGNDYACGECVAMSLRWLFAKVKNNILNK